VNHFCLGTSFVDFNIVPYLLKAGTVEPEKPPLLANGSKHPFLGNGSVNKFLRQGIHIQQQRYCWKLCFILGPCKRVIRKTVGAAESVLYRSL
jgi:hypothetical protein